MSAGEHRLLCEHLAAWREGQGFGVVLVEPALPMGWGGEHADVVSIDLSRRVVVVDEVKRSRADWLADARKPHRHLNSRVTGMGDYRCVAVPAADGAGPLIVGDDEARQAGIGLIAIETDGACRELLEPPARKTANTARAFALLCSHTAALLRDQRDANNGGVPPRRRSGRLAVFPAAPVSARPQHNHRDSGGDGVAKNAVEQAALRMAREGDKIHALAAELGVNKAQAQRWLRERPHLGIELVSGFMGLKA